MTDTLDKLSNFEHELSFQLEAIESLLTELLGEERNDLVMGMIEVRRGLLKKLKQITEELDE